jgi:hypothetical protein
MMNPRLFFIVSTLVELPIGFLLLTFPSITSHLLLGAETSSIFENTIARVAGVAIISLSIACWLSRTSTKIDSQRPVIAGMLFYNLAVTILLIYYLIAGGSTALLIVAIAAHALLLVACLYLFNRSKATRKRS